VQRENEQIIVIPQSFGLFKVQAILFLLAALWAESYSNFM